MPMRMPKIQLVESPHAGRLPFEAMTRRYDARMGARCERWVESRLNTGGGESSADRIPPYVDLRW
jgi:hypothetical protein